MKKELCQFKCPRWNNLPDFEVYMDQVIYFINDRLSPLYFHKEDKIITSNMVNNYVKNSIVHPPVKKHYKQYHLAFLIVVSILKRCYSLTEITQLIEIEDALNKDIDVIYDSFSECFEFYLHEIMSTGSTESEFFKEPTPEQQLMVNVIKTVVFKMYSEVDLFEFENQQKKTGH